MSLLLKRIGFRITLSVQDDLRGVDLHTLTLALRLHEGTCHSQAGTSGNVPEKSSRECVYIDDNLYVINRSSVIQCNKGNIFNLSLGPDPTLGNDLFTCYMAGQQFLYSFSLHG